VRLAGAAVARMAYLPDARRLLHGACLAHQNKPLPCGRSAGGRSCGCCLPLGGRFSALTAASRGVSLLPTRLSLLRFCLLLVGHGLPQFRIFISVRLSLRRLRFA